jgi:hypothetical protein
MFHLLAFSDAQAAGSTDAQLNAVSDQLLSIQANDFQMPVPFWLLAGYVQGTTITRGRFRTSSLSLRGNPQIWPFNVGVTLPPADPNMLDLREFPLKLLKEENLRCETSNTLACGTEQHTACALVTPLQPNYNINFPMPRWVRATSAVTSVAFGWSTLGALTMEDNLEGGSYVVLGMMIQEADCIFGRLVFQNQFLRPGCLGQAALTSKPHPMFNGGLGIWGFFNTYSLPQVETLHIAAAAQTLELRLLIAKADGFAPPVYPPGAFTLGA